MMVQAFREADMAGFQLQPAQAEQFARGSAWQATARRLSAPGGAFCVRREDGRAAALCGLYPVDPGYALGWAFLARDLGPGMVPLTRMVRRYLDMKMHDMRRIEMNCHVDFEPGVRWARMLEFEIEGVMRAAAPDGGDLIRFVRLREDAA